MSGFEVTTVTREGWRCASDRELLDKAEGEFAALVTIDKSMEHQQNLRRRNLIIVIVHVKNNLLTSYAELVEEIEVAIRGSRGGDVVHVGLKN